MLLAILLTFHILVCIALVGVVLLQRSEGGGLVSGGGGNFMTARGQGDLLTRTTWTLGTIFIVLSLVLTLVAGRGQQGRSVTDRFEVESIDPAEAARQEQRRQQEQQQAPPLAPQAPAPGEAPMPTLRNPLAAPPPLAPAAPAQP